MRHAILIAAILLISASARADGPRGLSLASNETTVTTEAPKTELPRAATQPAASDAASQPPKAEQVKRDPVKSASGRTEKPKVKRSPLEARVVDELHRHGIYW